MSWNEPDRWATLLTGDGCAMCADAHLDENPFSDLIAELSSSYVRLSRNQTHAGYCLVVLNRHETELHELPPSELAAFWSDVSRTGAAVSATFAPVKVDYLVMGHRMPHLHCHVYPQYHADDPTANVDISQGHLELTPQARAERIAALRQALVLVQ